MPPLPFKQPRRVVARLSQMQDGGAMIIPWRRAILISILLGVIGFVMLCVFSEVLGHLIPYPKNATKEQIETTWAIHVLWEKLAGFVIVPLCAITAAILLRGSWAVGFGAAIGSGLAYQAIAIVIYILRFGFSAYKTHHMFGKTLELTIACSALFGLLAICVLYLFRPKTKKPKLNQDTRMKDCFMSDT